jgi:hypothetical protein
MCVCIYISGGVWLLETEIVPSAGTIGGVDEVIKTVVFRDLFSLLKWSHNAHSEGRRAFGIDKNKDKDGDNGGGGGDRIGDWRPELDKNLCAAQKNGSHAQQLCEVQLLRSPLGRDHEMNANRNSSQVNKLSKLIQDMHMADEYDDDDELFVKMKDVVRNIFKSNGDTLYLDDRAVELSVEWELLHYRRGGYEPLAPCVSHAIDVKRYQQTTTTQGTRGTSFEKRPNAVGPSCFKFMNGKDGYCDAKLADAEKTFLFNKVPSILSSFDFFFFF